MLLQLLLKNSSERVANNVSAKASESFLDVPSRPDLPFLTKSDVAKHKTKESAILVTYQNGVYDITEFVPGHPGGDKILLAAGGSVDPFWDLYAQHKVRQ